MLQSSQPLTRAPTFHVPPQPTPFIGRAEEVVEITDLLADPACRLLTLVGPGGIGKTRLAIQVATDMSGSFRQGVYFVSLQAVRAAEFLLAAVADAFNFSLRGQEDPQIQLINFLSGKEILLVLDNFEQLLPPAVSDEAGIALLASILETAPTVKLLVTSREVLNLQEEWLYPVQGLPFPNTPLPAGDEQEEKYSAIQLFVERARRVRRDFSLAAEQTEVTRICQLVEGMPLALELAASWTKTLSCEVIAAEIQRNLNFLATNLRNVPERQRSMRAVFNHSWQLLSDGERNVFKRLSVFRGSFQRKAAEHIAKATLPILSALVDKSLLRGEPDGRYQIHELLHQYAAEQLVLSPDDVAHVYDRHCTFYADFLAQRADDIVGTRQLETIQEITAELENIRAAWAWAVQQVNLENIQKATYTFYHYCDFQGRYQEGADAFAKAIDKLDTLAPDARPGSTLALLLVLQGFHHIRLGRLEPATALLERGQVLFHHLGVPPPPGFGTDPLIGLTILATILGDYVRATELAEAARRGNEARVDKQNLQAAYFMLANIALAQGQIETAQQHAQQAYLLAEETNNRWFSAYVLSIQGHVARALGNYAQARDHYQASYSIKQALNDPEGMALALNHLGKVAHREQNFHEAERLYQQSQAIYQQISDRGGLATSLNGLGAIALTQANYQAAASYFRQGLQITADMQFTPLTLAILTGIAELFNHLGQPERSVELLTLALHHPASDHETKTQAQQLLTFYESNLLAEIYAAARQQGAQADLETMVAAVQIDLAQSIPADEQRRSGAEQNITYTPLPPGSAALVEPLTPRELEVLHFIAEGMTNQQIADELIISVGTAKFYTSQIYSKLNVSSRTQAVARARELGLLS